MTWKVLERQHVWTLNLNVSTILFHAFFFKIYEKAKQILILLVSIKKPCDWSQYLNHGTLREDWVFGLFAYLLACLHVLGYFEELILSRVYKQKSCNRGDIATRSEINLHRLALYPTDIQAHKELFSCCLLRLQILLKLERKRGY